MSVAVEQSGGDGSPSDVEAPAPVPISALQHAVYCLRQAYLIHAERMWAENRFTAEGRVLHAVPDRGGRRHARGVRRVASLPLASSRLSIAGVADTVEFRADGESGGETPFPIEHKRGRPKRHRADEVQLCAQGLCLEEMTGRPVPGGALFYGETKRRTAVAFDVELRTTTEDVVRALRAALDDPEPPGPTSHRSRCRACSLLERCRPDTVGRGVARWRSRRLAALLDDAAADDTP